jgi:amino acid transporter/nucleotide-binding universal stress UspA family protein
VDDVVTSDIPPAQAAGRSLGRSTAGIVVSSAMFTFISSWRTAAVVLCDLAGSAYYVGAIAEQSIGKAAPWFILAVLFFSYAVRSVYIESSALFIRGGVYRVVKEAMGGFLAKLSVSALMFDYVLTGPISGVSAGQYIIGLGLDTVTVSGHVDLSPAVRDAIKAWGSVAIAGLITLYFLRQNLFGIHDSSDKALKIMIATTVMAAILLAWCGLTLVLQGPANSVPLQPTFGPKPDPAGGPPQDPLGFISATGLGEQLRALSSSNWSGWMNGVGLVGLALALGHSILAMSGEETLAQVYREVEAPKLPNFKKAAFIVFVYSLLLTGSVSFLAVLLIPDDVRMKDYSDDLIGGLAMFVVGPAPARLLLHGFVVVVGFLILAGSVNTAIIGSNGVLNRVAEDGVLPDWFLRPHPRYGTTYRVLYLIAGLQLATILVSRGNVLALGEAYAFGVVWSFVFKALAMCVLRFTEPGPRPFKVPFNIRLGRFEVPIGLSLIFVVLLATAVMNFLTKETATLWGLGFTAGFMTLFVVSERRNMRTHREVKHEHLEQFNERTEGMPKPETLGLKLPFRRLVVVRTPASLPLLEKALSDTDCETTDLVVLVPKLVPPNEADVTQGNGPGIQPLNRHERELLTAVVDRAERAGKETHPLIVPTNNLLNAILTAARDLRVQEVMLTASGLYSVDRAQRWIAATWRALHEGKPTPLTVRLFSQNNEIRLELAGGSAIPRSGDGQPHSAADLRAAGGGIRRALLVCPGGPDGEGVLEVALDAFDPAVSLVVASLAGGHSPASGGGGPERFRARAKELGRQVEIHELKGDPGPALVDLAHEGKCDLIVVPSPRESKSPEGGTSWARHVIEHSRSRVILVVPLVVD